MNGLFVICWSAVVTAAFSASFGQSLPQAKLEWQDRSCAAILTNFYLHPNARHPELLLKSGIIGTNTGAFQRYALETTAAEFTRVANSLNFGIPKPLTCADFSEVRVTPSYYGLKSYIVVRNRFFFRIDRNRISDFGDLDFWLPAFENRPERLNALLAAPDLLTKDSAEKLARNALSALGLQNGKNINLREPPQVIQWETETGPMPFYDVLWKTESFTGPQDAETWHGKAIGIQVCGVTSNVCHFALIPTPDTFDALVLPYATNFFEFLGMSPTNRFWETKWKTKE